MWKFVPFLLEVGEYDLEADKFVNFAYLLGTSWKMTDSPTLFLYFTPPLITHHKSRQIHPLLIPFSPTPQSVFADVSLVSVWGSRGSLCVCVFVCLCVCLFICLSSIKKSCTHTPNTKYDSQFFIQTNILPWPISKNEWSQYDTVLHTYCKVGPHSSRNLTESGMFPGPRNSSNLFLEILVPRFGSH